MPHKTKKQKIAAEVRRKSSPILSQESKPVAEHSSVSVFKHDFRKSIYIVGLIITLEIIVYFGTMYKYLK